MSGTDIQRAIDAVWRIEAAKVIAALTRMVRNLDLAEDLAQEALVVALEKWPAEGIPPQPGAWLMMTAKHRALDYFRKTDLNSRKHEELARELNELERTTPDLVTPMDDLIGDDVLRLIFISCHPVLSMESRAALTLRVVGGLTTDEIARAFLTPEPTIAQRIVRAKKTLGQKNVPFEVPRGLDLAARLSSVLEVIYLIFNEGYSATAGEELIRTSLCEEALRLGRVLAELDAPEPEVHGLVGLMEIQASRSRARVNANGEVVLLMEQNRALWDQMLIRRGLTAVERANGLTRARGPYQLQAEIAACHARAMTAEATDWGRIVALYDVLARADPSPVVRLNRAAAVAMADGPAKGLAAIDDVIAGGELDAYYLAHSARADMCRRLGRIDEARASYRRALELARLEPERRFLQGRIDELGGG